MDFFFKTIQHFFALCIRTLLKKCDSHSHKHIHVKHEKIFKIEYLQQQITALQENQMLNDDKYSKVKQDNNSLLNK